MGRLCAQQGFSSPCAAPYQGAPFLAQLLCLDSVLAPWCFQALSTAWQRLQVCGVASAPASAPNCDS